MFYLCVCGGGQYSYFTCTLGIQLGTILMVTSKCCDILWHMISNRVLSYFMFTRFYGTINNKNIRSGLNTKGWKWSGGMDPFMDNGCVDLTSQTSANILFSHVAIPCHMYLSCLYTFCPKRHQ